MEKELRIYRTSKGKEPFIEWMKRLKDRIGKAQIHNRLNRIVFGNCGDCKHIGDGIQEMRVQYGPGYRVYFTEQENSIVLLLIGGTKRTQQKDIKKAKEYWAEFKERCYD